MVTVGYFVAIMILTILSYYHYSWVDSSEWLMVVLTITYG